MRTLYDIRGKLELLLLLVALPLIGGAVSGRPVSAYLEFPPLTRYVRHAGFSWIVFMAMAAGILAAVLPFVIRVLTSRAPVAASAEPSPRRFPWWGWAGLALTAAAWFMAWTRFAWLAPLQSFTFTPIWLGYVLTVNALAWRRTGRCLLTDRPRYLLGLFLLSAVFWWYFEYLNRFVQNWYYVGEGRLSRRQYFIFATLPFSTVLPAVLSTGEWLATMPRLSAGLDAFMPVRAGRPRALAGAALGLGSVSLAGVAVWPDYLFPLLWLSPLLIVTSLQTLRGEPSLFSSIARGDWRRLVLLALSALVCGCFWELWNWRSLTKWAYAVPYVNRFRIFEMPLLGYAGYLPFGLECAAVADFVFRRRPSTDAPSTPALPTPAGTARPVDGAEAAQDAAVNARGYRSKGEQPLSPTVAARAEGGFFSATECEHEGL